MKRANKLTAEWTRVDKITLTNDTINALVDAGAAEKKIMRGRLYLRAAAR